MSTYYTDEHVTLLHGDALAEASKLTDGSIDCIVTSPPYYGLRDYGSEGQYGHPRPHEPGYPIKINGKNKEGGP